MPELAHPWILVALPPVVVLGVAGRWVPLPLPGVDRAESVAGAALLPGWAPDVLRGITLACMLLVVAGPRSTERMVAEGPDGTAIMLAMDRSRSMIRRGPDGIRLFDAARRALLSFVESRSTDSVGLVLFSSDSRIRVPVTRDHDALLEEIGSARPSTGAEGTALGDAIATAATRLAAVPARHRILVVTTDGDGNLGSLSRDEAVERARRRGIDVHIVQATCSGEALVCGEPVTVFRESLEALHRRVPGTPVREVSVASVSWISALFLVAAATFGLEAALLASPWGRLP